jgi:lipoate---protein ligase
MIEDQFLRNVDTDSEQLLIYQNRPSVVMGRFQNPWLEVNLPWVLENDVTLVRRMSGGGCVYQDFGNINFAFTGPLKKFNKADALKFLQEKIKEFWGIEIEMNKRHDLLLKGKKISGSAFKQTKDRFLHHCTLLVDADLKALDISLQSSFKLQKTQSIPSVRSVVDNLSSVSSNINFKTLCETFGAIALPSIKGDQNYWQNRDWLWGETPYFEWQFNWLGLSFELFSRKGKIEKLMYKKDSFWIELEALNGEWFCAGNLRKYFKDDQASWVQLTGH